MESFAHLSKRVLRGACNGVLTGVGRGQRSQCVWIRSHQKIELLHDWVTNDFFLRRERRRTQAVISNEATVTPAGREEGICILIHLHSVSTFVRAQTHGRGVFILLTPFLLQNKQPLLMLVPVKWVRFALP